MYELTTPQARVLLTVVEQQCATLQEITQELGGHPNAFRRHLDLLEEHGLIAVSHEAKESSGRPAKVFSATDEGRKVAAQKYASQSHLGFLAQLVKHVAKDTDPRATSYGIGQDWGLEYEGKNAYEILEEQGFAPLKVNGGYELLACPLLKLAQKNPDVVCAIHQGLIDSATGKKSTLKPFVGRGCLVLIEEDDKDAN